MSSRPRALLLLGAAAALALAAAGVAVLWSDRGETKPEPAARAVVPAPRSEPEPDAPRATALVETPRVAAVEPAPDASVAPPAPQPKGKRDKASKRDSDEPEQTFEPPQVDPETMKALALKKGLDLAQASAERIARELELSPADRDRLSETMASIEKKRVDVAAKLNFEGADRAAIAKEFEAFEAWRTQELATTFGAELGAKITAHSRYPHTGLEPSGEPRKSMGAARRMKKAAKAKKNARSGE